MNVGVHVVRFSLPGRATAIGPMVAEIGRATEEAGVTNLSVMDHYLQMGGRVDGPDEPMLEGYTTLGYLAGHTRVAELQLLVTGVTYRHPGPTGQDRVHVGRTVRRACGARDWRRLIRAGARRAGCPVPPIGPTVRTPRGDAADRPSDVERRRRPVRRQVLPSLRDAQLATAAEPAAPAHHDRRSGGKKTLRLVAKYADAANLFAGPSAGPNVVRAKFDVLRRHCARVGTDYDRIRKTILYVGPLEPDAGGGKVFAEQMGLRWSPR